MRGNGNLLQHSCLKNSMDREAWWTIEKPGGPGRKESDTTEWLSTRHKTQLLISHSVMSNSLATPWTVVRQAPLSMAFLRQEYWSGLPFSFSRGSFWPRDRTRVSRIVGRCFTVWATRRALNVTFISREIYPLSYCILFKLVNPDEQHRKNSKNSYRFLLKQ